MSSEDLVIVDLATENAELRDRAASLEPFREIVIVAIDELAGAKREIEMLRRRNASLVDEIRTISRQAAA